MNDLLFGEQNAMMVRAVALRDFERDRAFIKLRRIESDGIGLEFLLQLPRGERGHDRGINSATEEAGHRDVGEEMFVYRDFEQTAHFGRRVLRGRTESLSRRPVAPLLSFAARSQDHGVSGRQDPAF